MGFWKEGHRGKVPLSTHHLSERHIQGAYHQHDWRLLVLTLITWCWPWSPGWGSVCQMSPLSLPFCPLSILYSLEGSYYVLPTLKKWRFMLNLLVERIWQLFKIFLDGRFVCSPSFIYLFDNFFILVWTHGIYFRFWIIIQCYFILLLKFIYFLKILILRQRCLNGSEMIYFPCDLWLSKSPEREDNACWQVLILSLAFLNKEDGFF